VPALTSVPVLQGIRFAIIVLGYWRNAKPATTYAIFDRRSGQPVETQIIRPI
jgi:hypothetical protein